MPLCVQALSVRLSLPSSMNSPNWQGFEVLSATTDGCMVKVPDTFAFTDIDEHGIVQGLKFDELFPSVYKNLCDYPTIQLLMQGRRNTGTDPHEWMEVKHAGSWASDLQNADIWFRA